LIHIIDEMLILFEGEWSDSGVHRLSTSHCTTALQIQYMCRVHRFAHWTSLLL